MASRLAVAAGWAGLILVVLLIGISAVRYRQDIAVIWPQSAGVYSSLGLKVSARGIDFREEAYGTNALQVPKLPDYAIIDLRETPGPRWPGKIVTAGFFDSAWK